MQPNVLLIHGVLMNSLIMRQLGSSLEEKGFKVYYARYHSVSKKSSENAKLIQQQIKDLNLSNLHIVAHSLGGVVTLHLFDQFDDIPSGRVLMLGSPVKGSWVARKLEHWPVASKLLANSMLQALAGKDIPEWRESRDWGMIAGTKNRGLGLLVGGLPAEGDGTVMLNETHDSKQTAHIVKDTSHTGLLFSQDVADAVADFLNTGQFQ